MIFVSELWIVFDPSLLGCCYAFLVFKNLFIHTDFINLYFFRFFLSTLLEICQNSWIINLCLILMDRILLFVTCSTLLKSSDIKNYMLIRFPIAYSNCFLNLNFLFTIVEFDIIFLYFFYCLELFLLSFLLLCSNLILRMYPHFSCYELWNFFFVVNLFESAHLFDSS